MTGLIQSFLFGIGGISRYLFFQLINILWSKNHAKDIDYYISRDSNLDANGFTTGQKNFLVGIILFFGLIVLIERFESR